MDPEILSEQMLRHRLRVPPKRFHRLVANPVSPNMAGHDNGVEQRNDHNIPKCTGIFVTQRRQ